MILKRKSFDFERMAQICRYSCFYKGNEYSVFFEHDISDEEACKKLIEGIKEKTNDATIRLSPIQNDYSESFNEINSITFIEYGES